MKRPVLFSIIESPMHPDFSTLYRRAGIDEIRIDSMRKALAQLKKQPPDFIVAEFFYGYGNNNEGPELEVRVVSLFTTDVSIRSVSAI